MNNRFDKPNEAERDRVCERYVRVVTGRFHDQPRDSDHRQPAIASEDVRGGRVLFGTRTS